MRVRSPGAWELIVEAGRDPVTGKRRQASRIFNGTLTEAKKARVALITEVSKGRHTGTKATLNEMFDDWIVEPPSIPNISPVVPTPEEVRALIDAAEQSRRPEYARSIFVAATTGLRRAELCGLRRWRDLGLERGLMRVSTSVVLLPGRPLGEIPTKNRRVRMLAVDDATAAVLRAQIQMVEDRARAGGVELIADPYVFNDAADGSEPWKPDAMRPATIRR